MQSNTGENARSHALTKTIKRYATQDREKRVRAASGKEKKMEEKQKTIYDLLDEVPYMPEKYGGGRMTEWDSSPEGKAYHRKAHQEWREKNREKSNEYHKEYMKTWRELNRDKINQKTKEWQIANHEKVKEYRRRYMAKWRDEHREEYREYLKRWKESHPEGKDTHTVTKEEWLERYGYPMGDTTGWENWQGWDTRIRKGAEE